MDGDAMGSDERMEEALGDFKVTALPPEAVGDKTGWNIGIIRMDMDPLNPRLFGISWMPEFFAVPMKDVVRKHLVKVLRFYADKLESGELEKRMKQFAPEVPK